MNQIACSIVLYNNKEEELRKVIQSIFQDDLSIRLFLVDNSATDNLKKFATHNEIQYIFNNNNIGFGRAHNIALEKSLGQSEFHLILNPDIEFSKGVLRELYNFMKTHQYVGQVMPKVFYQDGELQKLCHLLPGPFDLLGRRFFIGSKWAQNLNNRYELSGFNYDQSVNIPNLSGCFMFIRNEILQKVGGFDPRYFMYLEDVDLTRRLHAISETVFYPNVSIIHKFEKESYSNPVLLRYHISSAIKYFNKWGWFFDKERQLINEAALKRLGL